MPNDALTPDLSKLDKNYQILTELHADDGSRTYLARHLKLNRDVAVTVTWLLGDDNNALTHFAADAHLLTAMRHPNVIPVIEGIWLDQRSFAIVRARVRGPSLEHMIFGGGPVPLERVATTIQQVEAAIGWARGCGVVHRNVTPRSIMFQQGNGRVLLSLEPRPLAADAMPGECDDARTIARIASQMLSGQIDESAERTAIVVPPRLVPAVAQALEGARLCDRSSATTAVGALMTTLDAAAAAEREASVESVVPAIVVEAPEPSSNAAAVDLPPVVDRIVVPRPRTHRTAGARGAAIIRTPSPFGFNARLGSTVAVLGVVGLLSLVVVRHGETPETTASRVIDDTTRQAAGDVAVGATRRDSIAPIVSPPPTRAREPQPVAVIPSVTPRTPSVSARHTAAAAPVVEPCASSEPEDQRKCLTAMIDRNDRALNSVFAKLVTALRRQASAAASDPDPDTVGELRAAQRKWLDERDEACRDVGEPPLFARERSSCFAQQSANRARELQRMLEAVPPV